MSEKLLEEIERRLNAKTIHDLRQIARAVGVPRPADGRKERILDGIIQIAAGKSDPVAPAVRGAHPKSDEYDRQLVADVLRCREICLSAKTEKGEPTVNMSVASGEIYDPLDFTSQGILENCGGKWFLRVNGIRGDFVSDIFVNDYFVNRFKLREGDLIFGKCKRSSLNEIAGLASVITLNGGSPEPVSERLHFDDFIPVYPDKHLKTATDSKDSAGRIIDLFSPLGAGQRAVITGPHGSGKTALLKNIALGLKENNPDLKLIILLIDARPEEAADFKRSFPDTDVFASPFDAGVGSHVRTARIGLEFAKRQAELGKEVVLVLDDLTRLTRAYDFCGKQVTSALDLSALDSVKKFLAAAKNTEEGISLTIISALASDGGALDEAVYSALNQFANMRVSLKADPAPNGNPSIDIPSTRTSGAEKLLSEKQLKASAALRGNGEKALSLIEQTENNEELCEKFSG